MLTVKRLSEPLLEFGRGGQGADPREVLAKFGPFGVDPNSEPAEIPLGLVSPVGEIAQVTEWVKRMRGFLVGNERNARRFRQFPGTTKALHANFDVPAHLVRKLPTAQVDSLSESAERGDSRAFDDLLTVYADSIESLFSTERPPSTVLVVFPEVVASLRSHNARLGQRERLLLERLLEDVKSDQLSLFEPTAEELRAAADLLPQAEDLLFRTFHRALKARCMLLPNAVPLQVIRRHTYDSKVAQQSDATRAWNLGVGLYYKSGRIPWRPTDMATGTCFVGITFHHLKRRGGDLVYASLAQAFSTEFEPFALKGAMIPYDPSERSPHLSDEQAHDLVRAVVRAYETHTGTLPERVVIHKTSRYSPEEAEGFESGTLKSVAACDLVWLAPTSFRLLRSGMREPARGTLASIGPDTFLFTTGYVSSWDEYPGPHIPAPLAIGSWRPTDIVARAKEILSLTKMNWNGVDGLGRNPVTISFARRVGAIMTEVPEDATPNPLYRFYM